MRKLTILERLETGTIFWRFPGFTYGMSPVAFKCRRHQCCSQPFNACLGAGACENRPMIGILAANGLLLAVQARRVATHAAIFHGHHSLLACHS